MSQEQEIDRGVKAARVPQTVEVEGRTCRVFFSHLRPGEVSMVRVATLTKGDAAGGWRSLKLTGPLALAAIARATGQQGGAA